MGPMSLLEYLIVTFQGSAEAEQYLGPLPGTTRSPWQLMAETRKAFCLVGWLIG